MGYTEKSASKGVMVTQPLCTKGVHPILEGDTGDTRVTHVCAHSRKKSLFHPFHMPPSEPLMTLRWQPFGREGGLKSMPKHSSLPDKCHFSLKFSREFETLLPPFSDFTLTKPLNSLENLKVQIHLTTSKKLLPVGFRPLKAAERQEKTAIKAKYLANYRCTKRRKCAMCSHTHDILVSPVTPSKIGSTPSVYRHCVTLTP